MPYVQDVHIDQALTTFSKAITNDELVGDKILPPVPVDKRSDLWFIYGTEYFKKRDDLRRPKSEAIEIDWTMSKGHYNAEEHAEKYLVSDAEAKVADAPVDPAIDATEFVTASVQNQREIAQLALVTNAAQVTNNATLAGTTQWSDYTNSVPLTNIRTAKTTVRNAIVKRANFFSASYDVCLVLADHPSIKDLLKYTDPNALTSSGLPPTIRGLTVNEAGSMYDTANQGQAATFASIFGKNALVHYTTPSVGRKIVTFGYTMEAPDDTTGVRGLSVRRYRDDKKKGEYVEVSVMYDLQLVAPTGGYLYLAAIA